MKYLKVYWNHEHKDTPKILYHELDENGFEVRKVFIYDNEKFEFASKDYYTDNIFLSEIPIISLDEIKSASDGVDQFIPNYITKEEFEKVWNQALSFSLDNGDIKM